MVALQASAVLMWLVAAGFGIPAPFVASHYLRERTPWLLWNGEPIGARITLVLLPIEVVFWVGFAIPVPPLIAIVRLGLLAAGWSALR